MQEKLTIDEPSELFAIMILTLLGNLILRFDLIRLSTPFTLHRIPYFARLRPSGSIRHIYDIAQFSPFVF